MWDDSNILKISNVKPKSHLKRILIEGVEQDNSVKQNSQSNWVIVPLLSTKVQSTHGVLITILINVFNSFLWKIGVYSMCCAEPRSGQSCLLKINWGRKPNVRNLVCWGVAGSQESSWR